MHGLMEYIGKFYCFLHFHSVPKFVYTTFQSSVGKNLFFKVLKVKEENGPGGNAFSPYGWIISLDTLCHRSMQHHNTP